MLLAVTIVATFSLYIRSELLLLETTRKVHVLFLFVLLLLQMILLTYFLHHSPKIVKKVKDEDSLLNGQENTSFLELGVGLLQKVLVYFVLPVYTLVITFFF
eukprot:m.128953 g.128953  ORF g.128953 m.128953 type:complete len:102 (+) comp37959_c0_seq3:2374-2679(+)